MVSEESGNLSACFVVNWFRPAYKGGGTIRSVDHLIRNIHPWINIFVLTASDDFGNIPLDVPHGEKVVHDDCAAWYFPKKSILRGKVIRKILALNTGLVYMNSMFSLHFTIIPLLFFRFRREKPAIILAPEGMLQEGAIQNKAFKKHLFFMMFRLLGIHLMVTFHATNESEKQDVIRVFGDQTRIRVIPHYSATPVRDVKKIPKKAGYAEFVFISMITEKKNIHFFLDLIKSLEKEVALRFVIFGIIKDEAYWKACLELISAIYANVKVEFKGDISHHKVGEALEQSHFFVLPTHGENFGHAIFEALCVGRPVLISDKTPWKDLIARRAGWDLPLGDREKWKQVIRMCCEMDQEAYDQMSQNAYRYAVKFSNENKNDQLYRELFRSI